MKTQKGSFTIEAVIWIPFILFMVIGILQEGIHFYKICEEQEISDEVRNWNGVSRFYEIWRLKEFEEVWKNGQTAD